MKQRLAFQYKNYDIVIAYRFLASLMYLLVAIQGNFITQHFAAILVGHLLYKTENIFPLGSASHFFNC